jgi:Stage II sporulation protein E (SpoIIE)/GAF domain
MRAPDGLSLFGTAPEERFDRITSLAKGLLRVTMATIVLAGRDHRWSAQGLSPLPVRREDSFFDHPVRTGQPLVVADMAADPRFAGHPFVAGAPHIRCFAGYPLAAGGGQLVGTLCVMDAEPRAFSDADRTALQELAAWAAKEINRSAELDRAAEVQRGLLPRRDRLELPGYELAAACLPSRAVGGDLVDYYLAPDGDLVVTLGDVMGKGIGAAIMMATVRAAMRAAGRLCPPAEAVRRGAATLEEDLRKTNTLVTLCHLRVTPDTGGFRYSDAGHGLCLLVRAGVTLPRPGRGGLPLGVRSDDSWPEFAGRLLPGDTLVAFSDGLLDLYDSIDAALEAVRRAAAGSSGARAIVERVEALARRYPLADDVTMFALRRTG